MNMVLVSGHLHHRVHTTVQALELMINQDGIWAKPGGGVNPKLVMAISGALDGQTAAHYEETDTDEIYWGMNGGHPKRKELIGAGSAELLIESDLHPPRAGTFGLIERHGVLTLVTQQGLPPSRDPDTSRGVMLIISTLGEIDKDASVQPLLDLEIAPARVIVAVLDADGQLVLSYSTGETSVFTFDTHGAIRESRRNQFEREVEAGTAKWIF